MTQEEKNLLIGVLAALLPYEIKVQVCNITDYTPVLKGIIGDEIFVQFDYARPLKNGDSTYNIIKDKVKPYLRPMSSMTEEEKSLFLDLRNALTYQENGEYDLDDFNELNNFLNKRKLDRYDLIDMGIALEAPKGMYNFKND